MRILITGKGSYIGAHIKAHFKALGHEADEADTFGDEWQKIDYSRYDCVVHVAAIVHSDAKSASEELFRQVNTELPVRIARLAKQGGAAQFIFLSTMGVYGVGKTLSEVDSVIGADTPATAVGGYGGSKLAAEKLLRELEDGTFRVAVVRPPNIYGPGCRGNYVPLFRKLALLLPVCPRAYTDIRQSMLYIDNLSQLILLIAGEGASGTYLPQDDVAPNAVEMIRVIRGVCGKKTHESGLLGGAVRLFSRLPLIRKVYGGVRYDDAASDCFGGRYRIVSFADGMRMTFQSAGSSAPTP